MQRPDRRFEQKTQGRALGLAALSSLALLGAIECDEARAATLTVGGAGAAAPTLSLGVSMAVDGDTVLVASGTYNEIIVTSKAIAIVADGPSGSVIVDGGSFSSVLSFVDVAGPVALDGVLLRNGVAARGAALRLDGVAGGVTLSYCTFTGNIASLTGGAIDAIDTVVEISECEFENNTTDGAAEQRGGAISLRDGSSGSSIVASRFTYNEANFGGAVFFTGQVTLGECTFIDNTAERGGAVYSNDASEPTVTHCTFEGNSADDYGGAVYLAGVGGDIRWSTFEGNSSTTGGAIYLGAGNGLSVRRCLFNGNSAAHGGGIGGASLFSLLTFSTFYANTASLEGAHVFFNQSSPEVTQNIFASPVTSPSLHCEGPASPTIGCNLFDSGVVGAASGCDDPTGNDGNVEDDPLFCDAPDGDFGLNGDSSLAAAGNGPPECSDEGMGRDGTACGVSPIEQTSWGLLKSRYQ